MMQNKLNQYYFLLREASKKSSLVSIKAQQHIINHHFLLSFIFADFIRRTSEKKTVSILDLGSGNGFPAIILALCFENAKFTLVDSNRKKILFLRKVKQQLNLNCSLVQNRVEYLNKENNHFDYITALAFAPMNKLVELCTTYIKTGSRVITIKGQDFEKEISNVPEEITIKTHSFSEPWVVFNPEINNKILIEVKGYQ